MRLYVWKPSKMDLENEQTWSSFIFHGIPPPPDHLERAVCGLFCCEMFCH